MPVVDIFSILHNHHLHFCRRSLRNRTASGGAADLDANVYCQGQGAPMAITNAPDVKKYRVSKTTRPRDSDDSVSCFFIICIAFDLKLPTS